MKTVFIRLALVGLSINLTACSSNFLNYGQQTPEQKQSAEAQTAIADATADTRGSVGGNIGNAMDSFDKNKLSHALDSALGKPTQWINQNTGISYTVVPTEKVVIGDNQFCRKYTVTATKGTQVKESRGVACVGDDSNWHPV